MARKLRRLVPGLLIAGYVVGWALSPLVTSRTPSDLDLYFWPSAEQAAHGHPLLIYSLQATTANPNANGPLSLIPLLPAVMVANALGLANDMTFRAGAAGVIGAVFTLLLTWEALRIVRDARGGLEWRLAASCVFLLAPALIMGVWDYGHIEQPLEVWFVLLAVRWIRGGRVVLTGFALGLAALTRTIALLYVIPFGLLAVAARRLRLAGPLLVTTAATVAAGLAPFLIADTANVVHSLITYRGARSIGGGSLWLLALNTPLAPVAQQGDVYLAAAVAAVLCALLAWRRPASVSTPAGLCGMLTIVAACFPMLVKTVYPYYLVEPYVFAAVWWLARPGSALNWRVVVPLALIGAAFMAKWDDALPLTGLGLVEGVGSSVLLAGVVALVMRDLLGDPVPAASRPVDAGEVAAAPLVH